MYRKNAASQFVYFQGVDSSTGGIKSGVTWTMRRCLDGTFAAGGGTVTEDGTTGWYKCALAQADTNGNNCAANFTGTGAVPQTVNFITDGSPPDVNLKNAAGTAVTLDANNVLNVSTKYIAGLAQTAGDIFPAVTNIAVTGAALNAIAASELLTTGSDAGGVANTNTLDGVFDNWTDAAGTIDGYYQFDISATTGAIGVGSTWDGYLVGVVNTLKVYAYNWGGAAWDQVGTVVGIAGTVTMAQEWDLTSAHTGTGANLGLVRIRFNNTGLTAATLKTDRILLGYAVALTPAAIATGVWQDATAGDFTVASSIGKSLYIANVVPGGTGGHFIAGTNAATTITTGLTTHFIGTVDTLTTYTGNTPQTADVATLITTVGAAGAGLTSVALSAAGLTAVWAVVIDGTNSAIKLMRGFAAALLGKASGLATTTAIYRNVPDSKDVITATVDANGNRSAVTTDLT